jgi:hypothetical protein
MVKGIWAGTVGVALGAVGISVGASTGSAGAATGSAFVNQLTAIAKVGSTVPANGDVNPYGVAVVPTSTGNLVAGNVLISNFNSKANVQGTGTTLVQVTPSGSEQLFSQISSLPAGMACPGGVGLTTALSILPGGWVVVGSLPTSNGNLPKGSPVGCLIVLNSTGTVVETISNSSIVGPWDMTATSSGSTATLFVSNALGGDTKEKNDVPVAGNCTVARINLTLSPTAPPALASSTIIGSNFAWKANKTALVLAPTGLALSNSGTLFVDNALTNTVAAIPNAATRTTAVTAKKATITKGGWLNAPLGETLAPNGDVLVVNGNNGNIVEISPSGKQLAKKTLIKNGAGDLFGLAVTPNSQGLYFVNDGDNTLQLAQP